MNNIAIIPARSGSKGLKDKNIKELGGKPLMAYSIEAALKSNQFETVMVSTDSKEYAKVASEYGAEVPFFRSEKTSTDEAGSWDVVLEVLSNYVELGKTYDTVCLLQPTSPLRKVDDIINSYKMLEEKRADAITSVCEVDHSPWWTMKLPSDRSMKEFRKDRRINAPRQKLDMFYRLNGDVYIRKIKYINDGIEILEQNEYAYIMLKRNSVDIDTIDDFKYAEFLIKKEDES